MLLYPAIFPRHMNQKTIPAGLTEGPAGIFVPLYAEPNALRSRRTADHFITFAMTASPLSISSLVMTRGGSRRRVSFPAVRLRSPSAIS